MPQGTVLYLKFDLSLDADSRVRAFDFKNILAPNDTITGQNIEQQNPSGATPLTLSGIGVVGSQVQVRITGGTVNTLYSLSCTATTAGGDTLVASGGLQTFGSA